MAPLLSIEKLVVRLPSGADRAYALKDVSLELSANEILCVVGESGSGKSVLAAAIMGLLPPEVRVEEGRIVFEDQDIIRLPGDLQRRIRGARIAMIFQEPMTALNPLHRIGDQIGEMFRAHTRMSAGDIERKVLALLDEVLIPDPWSAARAYPHELSGGQRQRAMIAMALALEPKILIADEPTTALDVTTQAQILNLICGLQRRKGMAVLFITHDFGVVAEVANRVAVMRNGLLVEQGPAEKILNAPSEPYTKALISAVPSLKPPPPRPVSPHPILRIDGLTKVYSQRSPFAGRRVTHALNDVTLEVAEGSTLGIVGESGSGKSTLARCIVGLLKPDAGAIHLGPLNMTALSRAERRRESHRVQIVFQDPYGSLNPRRRAGDLVAQGPIAHGVPAREARDRARRLFALVGLDPASADRFPHEFSGGQRQRIGLARALALEPELLVADEPVSALDVSVQAQVLKLLADLRKQLGLSMVFITHDLRVAAQICDHIVVMKDGFVVESGSANDVLGAPQQEYTQLLVRSIPGQDRLVTAN